MIFWESKAKGLKLLKTEVCHTESFRKRISSYFRVKIEYSEFLKIIYIYIILSITLYYIIYIILYILYYIYYLLYYIYIYIPYFEIFKLQSFNYYLGKFFNQNIFLKTFSKNDFQALLISKKIYLNV